MTIIPTRISLRIAALLAAAAVTWPAMAQRRVTPVEDPQAKAKTSTAVVTATDSVGNTVAARPASVIEQTDLQGRRILVDTISGREYRDTILTQAPKLIYPRFDAVTIGVNFYDAIARAVWTDYGLFSVWGELSIHNWFKPMVEFGLGSADYMPKDESYRYRSPVAPFFKVGLNYNFLYNSDPAYSVYLGVRYGISSFRYSVGEGTANSGYWQEQMPVEVPSQRATAGYFEGLVGLRVGLWKGISLGWEIKMHAIVHKGTHRGGNPWYVPGYGVTGTPFMASFSISYTLPLHRRPAPATTPAAEQ